MVDVQRTAAEGEAEDYASELDIQNRYNQEELWSGDRLRF